MISAVQESAKPRFWRDDALAFVEVRSIESAREVHYAKHAHETFSIGAITAGSCTYLNGRVRQRINAGSVVLMNPGDVHACNPIGHERWSYRMLYVGIPWLVNIQNDLGVSRDRYFRPFSATATTKALLYCGLNQLYGVLIDRQADPLQKHEAALAFMTAVQFALTPAKP